MAEVNARIKFYDKNHFKSNFHTERNGATYVSLDEYENGPNSIQWCWFSDAGEEGECTFEEYQRVSSFCELENPADFI